MLIERHNAPFNLGGKSDALGQVEDRVRPHWRNKEHVAAPLNTRQRAGARLAGHILPHPGACRKEKKRRKGKEEKKRLKASSWLVCLYISLPILSFHAFLFLISPAQQAFHVRTARLL
jgi:hypothetical protein